MTESLPVKWEHAPDLAEYPFPAKSPVPNTEVVFDRASIEVARAVLRVAAPARRE